MKQHLQFGLPTIKGMSHKPALYLKCDFLPSLPEAGDVFPMIPHFNNPVFFSCKEEVISFTLKPIVLD